MFVQAIPPPPTQKSVGGIHPPIPPGFTPVQETLYQLSSVHLPSSLRFSDKFQMEKIMFSELQMNACILCELCRLEYNLFCSIGFVYSADYCLFYLAAKKASCWIISHQSVDGFKSYPRD